MRASHVGSDSSHRVYAHPGMQPSLSRPMAIPSRSSQQQYGRTSFSSHSLDQNVMTHSQDVTSSFGSTGSSFEQHRNPWSWMLLLPGEKRDERVASTSLPNMSSISNRIPEGRQSRNLVGEQEDEFDIEVDEDQPSSGTNCTEFEFESSEGNNLNFLNCYTSQELPPGQSDRGRRGEGDIFSCGGSLNFIAESISSLRFDDTSSPTMSPSPMSTSSWKSAAQSRSFMSPSNSKRSRSSSRDLVSPTLEIPEKKPSVIDDPRTCSSMKKRNMTQGRKEQRRRAMVRRAMRHLLEWPADKQEKCNRNYGLLIIEMPEAANLAPSRRKPFVLPCKEVRRMCTCEQCRSTPNDSQEVRAREINHFDVRGDDSLSGVLIKWNDGHSSKHSYADLIALHSHILNVPPQSL